METLGLASDLLTSNLFMQEGKSTKWTKEENKKFESALAIFDKETPDRWIKVAAMIPGKSVFDVMNQYMELLADVSDIENGLVPIPGYLTSSFTLEWVDSRDFDAFRKKSSTGRSDQERKKGVPWTEEEHRRFLLGLQEHGKGDWRNIARNFVISKTPTQVASHAQKFYLRQLSGGKDKRRPSIHDITAVSLTDTSLLENNSSPSTDKSTVLTPTHKSSSTPKILLDWNHPDDGAVMVFNSTHGNPFMACPYEIVSRGPHQLQRNAHHEAHFGPQNSRFQIHATRYQIHG
ncbi:unnamed protein product [Ilex paraguariensis]|uniref:Uncharacterized protein n=1 Tax=Ilex paraguariensis TaxID=185542 RepID=A0ABC8TXH4_9AQUA